MLEPYVPAFARFEDTAGNNVLEILYWHECRAHGVGKERSATPVWDRHYCERGRAYGEDISCAYSVSNRRSLADAKDLPFEDPTSDIVYSWGVL
jgi:hypothetical protein